MKPFFEQDGITLYNADCRELLDSIGSKVVVLTGPPWYEHAVLSDVVIATLRPVAAIYQWKEIAQPPSALPLVAVHIWNHTNGDARRYQPFFHFASNGHIVRSEVIRRPAIESTSPEYVGCPYQYPVEVAQWLIQKLDPDLPILDPFCGSGTTLLAARNLGRKAIGIELDEGYAQMAVRRLIRAD